MPIAFWAKADQLVPVPGYRPTPGTMPEYVGRELLVSEDGKRGSLLATAAPYVCPTEEVAARLVHLCRRDDCLTPANVETARLCGVSFVAHELVDGAMVPVSPKPRATGA